MVLNPLDPPSRTCSRAGCRRAATASLSFRYATSQAWLLDLAEAPDPSLYDLCPDHAEALTVPRGWERVDQRTPLPPPEPTPEPAAEPVAAAGAHPPSGEGRHAPHTPDHRPARPPNRYAALSAELPRLAAEVAATQAHADTAHPAAPAASGASEHPAGGSRGSAPAAGVSPRRGAPLPAVPRAVPAVTGPAAPARNSAQPPAHGMPPGAEPWLDPDALTPELDGQLALDVDVFDGVGDDAARGDAVVVPFGARRRGHGARGNDLPEPVKP